MANSNELWTRLRRLQMNPAHAPYRPFILEALVNGCLRWFELCDRLEACGVDLRALWHAAPEPAFVAEAEAERLDAKGIARLTPASPGYPTSWLECVDPALTLTVCGSVDSLSLPSLAVVGSREPSAESLRWMETELAPFCRSSRAVVVSGGARGVDQKAHSIALRTGSPTVVFLPSGIENPYPSDFSRWLPAIVEGGGAVVSEYPATSEMRKQNFHHRNRLIAVAGRMTLIIEARAKSGSLITAMRAAEIGRPLFVVPAHPGDLRYAGNLQLLSEGATMLRQNEDLTLFWQIDSTPQLSFNRPLGDEKRVVFNP